MATEIEVICTSWSPDNLTCWAKPPNCTIMARGTLCIVRCAKLFPTLRAEEDAAWLHHLRYLEAYGTIDERDVRVCRVWTSISFEMAVVRLEMNFAVYAKPLQVSTTLGALSRRVSRKLLASVPGAFVT